MDSSVEFLSLRMTVKRKPDQDDVGWLPQNDPLFKIPLAKGKDVI